MASIPLTLLPISSLPPPSSKQEAISQAKSSLQKALNKPLPLPSHKPKPHLQPRFRIEIPIADYDSPSSLISLASDLFSSLPITKNNSKSNLLLFWPSPTLLHLASHAFPSPNSIFHADISSPCNKNLNFTDLAVFLAPEASMLDNIRVVTNSLSPKAVVLFNPRWGFEEEKGFGVKMRRFIGSFDVVYCFMGLEVRGVLSRRRGVVFKGEGWVVMVEDEGKKGELRVVSRFERRPEIGEVENVLYNLMAANSPVTKSVRFFRELVSSVVGRKRE